MATVEGFVAEFGMPVWEAPAIASGALTAVAIPIGAFPSVTTLAASALLTVASAAACIATIATTAGTRPIAAAIANMAFGFWVSALAT